MDGTFDGLRLIRSVYFVNRRLAKEKLLAVGVFVGIRARCYEGMAKRVF